MKEELALELIRYRMRELGFAEAYHTRLQHYVVAGNERLDIQAFNEYYFLVAENENVRIRSDFGHYDLNYPHTDGQDYEHHGQIFIQNLSPVNSHVRFIQVIPKH